MPESIRFLTSRLSESATKFFSPARKKAQLPLTVSVEVESAANRTNPQQTLKAAGLTQDFSRDDINFVLPFVRLGEHYLAGREQKLILELALPERNLRMKATADCYEMIEAENGANQYLIRAKITAMNEAEREYLEEFIKHGETRRAEEKGSLFDAPPKARKASLLGHLFNL